MDDQISAEEVTKRPCCLRVVSLLKKFLMQAAFVADDVSNIIKESIDAVLQNQQYSESKVGAWSPACIGCNPCDCIHFTETNPFSTLSGEI